MDITSVISAVSSSLLKLLLDLVYFPFWWYSVGFIKVLVWSKNFIIGKARGLAILVWLKNIFTPMFGQRDWVGMLISFFMRVVQIIARSIMLFFWIIFVLIVICLWLITPIYIVYQIIFQMIGPLNINWF
ncbi:MAG: hypothetical protein QY321_01985 [Patescibacteria group bacterium]|nr:MAG: hypothetical protein QY321_01985 [Patescibacteria group bacterium]